MPCGFGGYSPKVLVMRLLFRFKEKLEKKRKEPLSMTEVEASLPLLVKEG
jgi:hypothetical protein